MQCLNNISLRNTYFLRLKLLDTYYLKLLYTQNSVSKLSHDHPFPCKGVGALTPD